MKKLLLGAVVALLPLTGFSATILGFQAGGGLWTHDPSGSVSTSADAVGVSADLKNDLKLSEEQEGYTYFLVEHPVPLVPNFKYVDTKLTSSGNSGTATFTFDTVDYNAAAVDSKFELNQTDMIFYYEILDNVISLDVGLNAKNIDGQVAISNTTPTTFSGTIPMIYVAAEILLPAGFALAGEISTISAAGNEITDLTAKVTYTTDFNLGVEAGVRTQNIVVDVDDVQANVKFSGLFAGVYFKF